MYRFSSYQWKGTDQENTCIFIFVATMLIFRHHFLYNADLYNPLE